MLIEKTDSIEQYSEKYHDYSNEKELAPFMSQPKAMPVGVFGKCGFLRLGFEVDSSGKSILRDWERRVPLIVQKALYFDENLPEIPCVYILSSGGPNVDGDRYAQVITLKKDSMAYISTGASTKIGSMKYNFSALNQLIELEENAYLEYIPEPVIPSANSRFFSKTIMRVDKSATIFYSEIYMCGRKFYDEGEIFKYDLLMLETVGKRLNDEVLYKDKSVIKPKEENPAILGIMGDNDVFANIIIMTPKDKISEIHDLLKPLIGIKSPGIIKEGFVVEDQEDYVGFAVNYLSNDAGLIIRVLGKNTTSVKRSVRFVCSQLRTVIKGVEMPEEFPWR